MIVEKSPLYFELEVVYKLLKLHNAIEESNSSQHTKQTHTYMYIYITRKESGDTVANYGCNKAVVAIDNTRIKNINYRMFRLPMSSLLQRFSTIYTMSIYIYIYTD